MSLRLHSKFLDALAELTDAEQKRVRGVLNQLVQHEITPGLRQHKVGDFVSFSAGMDLRVLAVEEPAGWALVHVDHHDDAYRWGERHTAYFGEEHLLLAVMPSVSEQPNRPNELAKPSSGYNRFAALPAPIASVLNSSKNELELLDLIAALSPEWQEVALSVAELPNAGNAPSDVIAVDDEILQFALALPAHKWRVFLHPKQRVIVEMPAEKSLLIRGGPGTGKTVCLAHRFVRLARQSTGRHPKLLALNQPAREAIRSVCASLGYAPPEGSIVDFGELGKKTKLDEVLNSSSALIVDEGQDLPVEFIARVIEALETGVALPPLTIAFDPNQAIVEPSGDALSRLISFADLFTLTYCYRMTDEIRAFSTAILGRLHTDFSGKRFQDQHHINARRDSVTAQMTSGVTGPEVDEVKVESSNLAAVASERALALAAELGGWDSVGVVVVGDHLPIRKQLQDEGIPVATPESVKGLEFLRGVVVENLPPIDPSGGVSALTSAGYRERSGFYVAVTRFRDHVAVLRMTEQVRGS